LTFGTTTLVTFSSDSGYFSFSNVYGPINYTVTVQTGGITFTSQSNTLWGNTTLDFAGTPKRYTLTALAIDSSGNPIPGATIDGGSLGTALTSEKGVATFSVDYGANYTLSASSAERMFSAAQGTIPGDITRVFVGAPEL
jgi:hypothetical protein